MFFTNWFSDKHKKKKKKKKDKKKKAKSEPFDDSNAASASYDETTAFNGIKGEAFDNTSTRTDSIQSYKQNERFSHPTDRVIKQERRSSSPEIRAKTTQQAEISRVKHEYGADAFEYRNSRSEIYDGRVSSKSERSPRRSPIRRDRNDSRTRHSEQQRGSDRTFERDRSNSNPRYRHHSRDRDGDNEMDRHTDRNKYKTHSHRDSRRYK